MRKYLLSLLLICLPAAAGTPVASGLSILDDLTGSCWQGVFDNGAMDTHCWSRVLDGQWVLDSHVVRGKGPGYKGDTYYGNDGDELRFRYFNSLGGYSEGVTLAVQGGLDFPAERYSGKDGTKKFLRSRLRWLDKEHYTVITEQEVDGEWQEVMRVIFARVSDEVAP